MRYVDIDTWDRWSYFQRYLGTDFPYIVIGADIDVTGLLAFSRKNGLSSYLAMIFSAHHVAESMESFRYRILDGRPIINERMCPSFTYIPEGSDLFVLVTMDFVDDVLEFHERARARITAQNTDPGLDGIAGRYDIIGYSAVPWIQFTHVMRTIGRLGADSNPKMTWGKYFQRGDRMLMPFSVQVHHGLMDGLHVGRYFEELQRYLDGLE